MKIAGNIEVVNVDATGSVTFRGAPILSTGSVGVGVIYYDIVSGKLLGTQNGSIPEEIIGGGGGITILSYIGF